MNRVEAIYRIERELDNRSFEPKLDDAISLALFALKAPEEMCCRRCENFTECEDAADGWGHCKEFDRDTCRSDGACEYYE